MSRRKRAVLDTPKDLIAAVGAVPSRRVLQRAQAILAYGGLVAYPTRCLYGLGVDALNADAVGRVYRVKQRPVDKPLSILIPDRKDLRNWTTDITPGAQWLMERFWPGKVTFILRAGKRLPAQLLGNGDSIGVRLPAHGVAAALLKAFGRPLTATSANLSGSPGCRRIEEFAPEMVRQLDLILDAGALEGGIGSTVVDLTGDTPAVVREGVVSAGQIGSAWQTWLRDGGD